MGFIPALPGLESCVANIGTYPVVLFLVFSELLNELYSMNRRKRKVVTTRPVQSRVSQGDRGGLGDASHGEEAERRVKEKLPARRE